MPATSKAQQKFMGMVHGLQKGTVKPSDVSAKVKKVADSMSDKDAEDFASTKHKKLPNKVKKEIIAKLRELVRIELEGTCGYAPDGKLDVHNTDKLTPAGPHLLKKKKKNESVNEKTVSIGGEELMKYLMKRFKMSKSKAIATMKKHKMDMSFLKKESVEEGGPGSGKPKDGSSKEKSKKDKEEMERKAKEQAKKDMEDEFDFDFDESVDEERDYKAEYKKYGSSTKAKKYRAELNQYNRKKGTYGNGDGKDASHKGGKIVGFEAQSKNRGRAEKSRLKKESVILMKNLIKK